MRALICAFGSHGDVLPMIAIGAELRRRGHEVALASAEPFGPPAHRAGLDFEALATTQDYLDAASSPDLWRPLKGARLLFELAERGVRPHFDFIERRRRKGETIVVSNSLALGARMAHDAFGTPLVTVHMTAALMQSRRDPPRLAGMPRLDWLPPKLQWDLQIGVDERVIDPAILPQLNAIRAEVGLKPVGRLRHWWHAPRRSLLMCPDWYASPQSEWPAQLRQCAFPDADRFGSETPSLAPELETFLSAGAPVAAVTFGSAMPGAAKLYRAAVEACARAGLRAVVMTSTALDLPPDLAGQTYVTPYAPLSLLAGRCAAALHHGGVGTLSRFFAAGVPQIVVPIAFDHFDNADRMVRLGCGAVMSRRWFSARRAAAKLKALRSSAEVADACRRVSAMSGVDGTIAACDEIEAEFAAAQARRASRRAQGG